MAKPTAKKLETTSCRKIDDGNPNNSANTDIYAYSETTFAGPTIGSVMTENRIYGVIVIWDTRKIATKKQCPEFVL